MKSWVVNKEVVFNDGDMKTLFKSKTSKNNLPQEKNTIVQEGININVW